MKSTLPLLLALVRRPLRPAPRVVDGALAAGEDHAVVEERAGEAAAQCGGKRPVEPIRVGEEVAPVAQSQQGESGSKVARGIQGGAGLVSKGHAQNRDDEAYDERVHARAGRGVAIVAES